MRLLQFLDSKGARAVGVVHDTGEAAQIAGVGSVRDLALQAARADRLLAAHVAGLKTSPLDYDALVAEGRLLPPIDHVDPAHCWITGTGLTHLGSARARNEMHEGAHAREKAASQEPPTDSMRMFEWGVAGGKPAPGQVGVQPEWFYKGNGEALVPPGQPLTSPGFAEDASDEAEVAGVYVIADDGTPLRLGFVLGNELSDHVMERKNYLYLAHSKIRPCSIGPELRVGALPRDVRGTLAIRRAGAVVFEGRFASGEDNMAHHLSNLEHHQFKYAIFRHPGDVHIHFFGADLLSYSAGFRTQAGDVFQIAAEGFGRPLENPLREEAGTTRPAVVRAL